MKSHGKLIEAKIEKVNGEWRRVREKLELSESLVAWAWYAEYIRSLPQERIAVAIRNATGVGGL